jgi:hypothetical protein
MKDKRVWANIGFAIKIPLEEIPTLQNFIEKNGYYLIYQTKPTLKHIQISLISPSGGIESE